MPWKTMLLFLLMSIMVVFIGFNLDNRVDISFGFHTIENVPVSIGLFVSFFAGSFVMLPYTFRRKKAIKEKMKKKEALPDKEDVTKDHKK